MVREWLEQQAVTGLLEVDVDAAFGDERQGPGSRTAGPRRSPTATAWPTPSPRRRRCCTPWGSSPVWRRRSAPAAAWWTGWREGRPDGNRARYLTQLTRDWLPAVGEVHARLLADPPARVADLGVGSGWSGIAMARAYPKIRVDGFDVDEVAIGFASAHADEAGVGDRVMFLARDASDHEFAGRYDLVTVFEALHDLARPVQALAAALRRLLGAGGSVVAWPTSACRRRSGRPGATSIATSTAGA